MPFQFERLEIPAVVLVRLQARPDDRGFFMETFKRSEFEANGISGPFVQDNYSRSSHGVLRGLHYQSPPKSQGKLINVIRGEVFDVAVDIRRGSPTYAHWVGLHLSSEDPMLLYVPVGFAHGFQVLSAQADVMYKVTEEYSPEADRGIAWNDPDLGIAWPIRDAVLSTKDAGLPSLAEVPFEFVIEGDARR